MSDDGVYDEAFREMTRRIDLERELANLGVYVVREGEAVLSGRIFEVKACSHRDCNDGRHASLTVPEGQERAGESEAGPCS